MVGLCFRVLNYNAKNIISIHKMDKDMDLLVSQRPGKPNIIKRMENANGN